MAGPITWPADLGKATIVGRFGYVDADHQDADSNPDITPVAVGTITLKASVDALKYKGSSSKMTLLPLTIEGVLDSDGYLHAKNTDGSMGNLGIIVPATNSSKLSPTDFVYSVTVTLPDRTLDEFHIKAPEGTTIDLADVIPTLLSYGSIVVVDGTAADRAEAAASSAASSASSASSSASSAAQSAQNINANTFTIGTVTEAASAKATITGSLPNQKLNLELPKADGINSITNPSTNVVRFNYGANQTTDITITTYDSGWVNLTTAGSVKSYSRPAGYNGLLQYRVIGKEVRFRNFVYYGANNSIWPSGDTIVANLPSAIYPAQETDMGILPAQGNVIVTAAVTSGGVFRVNMTAATNVWVSCDLLTYILG